MMEFIDNGDADKLQNDFEFFSIKEEFPKPPQYKPNNDNGFDFMNSENFQTNGSVFVDPYAQAFDIGEDQQKKEEAKQGGSNDFGDLLGF